MGKIYLTFLFTVCLSIYAFAQDSKKVVNINPDPDGEPWIVEGYTPPSPESRMTSSDIEMIKASNGPQLKSGTLPVRIDHSKDKYMRPAFNQVGGSCGSASRICYMFAYELNCYRNVAGNLPINKYPSHFTWLLTGQNSGKAGMAKGNGVPDSEVYGGDLYSGVYGGKNVGWPNVDQAPDYGWMNGYDKWHSAMQNRLEKNGSFSLNTPEALEDLKEWFNNHWGDNSYSAGGVAGAGCAISKAVYAQANNGQWMVKEWGPQVDHGTTWAGYDDEVAYDFNGDGRITNNLDTNGDGRVDMLDWEKGALIMLNSWGANWKNSGTVYVPYRLLKKNNMGAELYWIRKDYKPRRTIKLQMNYSARCELKLRVGIAANIHATAPEKTVVCEHFNYAGNGKVPLLGKWADGRVHTESMEFGYDMTDLTRGFDATQPLKYFIQVETKSDAIGTGKIEKMTLMNYEFDAVRETIAESENVEIMIGGATTMVAAVMPGGKAIPSKYIPCKDWTLLSCNSQENSSTRNAANVIDGDLNTFWHTRWSTGTDPFPHELVVDMGKNYELNTFEYFPRQDGSRNGHIGEYELYLSEDRYNWGDPEAAGNWTYSSFSKVVSFNTQTARYFKLVSKSEASGGAWSSAAEFRFLAEKSDQDTAVSETLKDNLKVWYHGGQLHINNLKKGGMISLLNITGREVFTDQINGDNPVISLPLTKGVYLVVVIDGADKHCKKIVVR